MTEANNKLRNCKGWKYNYKYRFKAFFKIDLKNAFLCKKQLYDIYALVINSKETSLLVIASS